MWRAAQRRALLEIRCDLTALQPQLPEFVARQQCQLIGMMSCAALPGVAVAHQSPGAHGCGELDHGHPGLAMPWCANALGIRIRPRDDTEGTEIAKASIARQVDLIEREARYLTEWSIDRTIFATRLCDGPAQHVDGGSRILDASWRTEWFRG